MAKAKIETNMFMLLFQLKKNYESLSETLSANDLAVCQKFISSLESYIQSVSWTNNELDKKIIALAVQGFKPSEIKEVLSLSEGTYRVKISRMTHKVYSKVFKDAICPKAVYDFTNIPLVKWYTQKINSLDDDFSLLSELNANTLLLIKDYCSGVSDIIGETISDKDIFNVLGFIAILTREVTAARLDTLNPEAVAYVISELEKNEFNEIYFYLKTLMKNYKEIKTTSDDKRIAKLKDAYSSLLAGNEDNI